MFFFYLKLFKCESYNSPELLLVFLCVCVCGEFHVTSGPCLRQHLDSQWASSLVFPLHDRSPALASEERLRQLPIRVHANRTSGPAASSQQDLARNLKNKREVRALMSRGSGTSPAPIV